MTGYLNINNDEFKYGDYLVRNSALYIVTCFKVIFIFKANKNLLQIVADTVPAAAPKKRPQILLGPAVLPTGRAFSAAMVVATTFGI
jgi:hypothetical protein